MSQAICRYLSRLEKESVQKSSSGGAKHMDSPPKEADINSGHQSPRKILPAEVPSSSSCAFSGGNSIVQHANQDAANVDPKGIASTPVPQSRINDILSPHKAKKARVGFDHSLSPLPLEGNPDAAIDSTVSPQYSWNDVPEVLESKPVLFESSFLQQPLPSQSYYTAHSATSFTETELEVKRSYENDQTSGVSRVTPVSDDEFLLAQGKSPTANLQDFDLSIPSAVSCMKPQEFNPNIPSNTESILRNLNWQLPESHFNTSLDSEFQLCWLQGDCFLANNGLQDTGFTNYSSQSFLAEPPFCFYDATRFANDLLPDPDEYSLVDQGLFIA